MNLNLASHHKKNVLAFDSWGHGNLNIMQNRVKSFRTLPLLKVTVQISILKTATENILL